MSHLHLPTLAPTAHRSNFIHLYLDVVWYGVLNASNLTFVNVFAARQGAAPFEIGLLTAGPAVVNIIFALPVGHWLQKQPIDAAVFWASVFTRIFYLFWIPLPWLLAPHAQVWVLIGLTLLMSIPATALVVGFNGLFAEAVPPEWRSQVTGIRNALLAVTTMIGAPLCGWILNSLPFPTGYQIVFGIGFLGAALSSLHLWFVCPAHMSGAERRARRSLRRLVRPASEALSLRSLLGQGIHHLLRIEVLRSSFGRVLAVLFGFHLTQYLPIPLFAVYFVKVLHLSDQQISLGYTGSYLVILLGSLVLTWFTRRWGYQKVTGVGAMLMVLYPGLMALSSGFEMFMVASSMGSFGWALVSGAFLNYILERAPAEDRPAHLAWYNMTFNAAILLGSLLGPLLADRVGLASAIALFALGRLVTGLCILRWG